MDDSDTELDNHARGDASSRMNGNALHEEEKDRLQKASRFVILC